MIASEVGLDLMIVDVSRLVSKWIGDTEKHLDAVFTEAEASSCVLFFDEADALFGHRLEGAASSGADRYANLEVGYLLQRLERYEGLVILASNLRANLDAAFTRRFHHVVHFPRPTEAERLRLWQLVLAPPVALAEPVDVQPLASLDLTGAGIAAIVRDAALAAHGQGRSALSAADVLAAASRQFRREARLLPRELSGMNTRVTPAPHAAAEPRVVTTMPHATVQPQEAPNSLVVHTLTGEELSARGLNARSRFTGGRVFAALMEDHPAHGGAAHGDRAGSRGGTGHRARGGPDRTEARTAGAAICEGARSRPRRARATGRRAAGRRATGARATGATRCRSQRGRGRAARSRSARRPRAGRAGPAPRRRPARGPRPGTRADVGPRRLEVRDVLCDERDRPRRAGRSGVRARQARGQGGRH